MPSEKRKANRQQYLKAVKRSKKYERGLVLREGMQGFLITCNNREKDTVRESYNILNEYTDKLVGPEKKPDDNEEGSDQEEEDIDAAFDKEKSELKSESDKKPQERRFQQVESGANNCIFIKTTIEDPHTIVDAIIDDIQDNQIQKCRFIQRMLPILGTCKAYDKNIIELGEQLIPKMLKTVQFSTYSILFKPRNSNQVSKEMVYKIVGDIIKNCDGSSLWKLDLNNPEVSIVVEVIRNVCCIGFVSKFYQRKKYNLLELVKQIT